jgi:hypothetical protein
MQITANAVVPVRPGHALPVSGNLYHHLTEIRYS